MKDVSIPQTLDDPPLALVFNGHHFISFILFAAVGVIIGYAIPCAILGLVAGSFFTRYAQSKPNGFLRHLFYFYGIPTVSTAYPNGLDREYRP